MLREVEELRSIANKLEDIDSAQAEEPDAQEILDDLKDVQLGVRTAEEMFEKWL